MIGFKNQTAVIKTIVAGLVDADDPQCWNLVLPPGFGDDAVIDSLVKEAFHQREDVLLAEVAPDSVPNVEGYIRSLHSQWGKRCKLPPLPENQGPSEIFDFLLAALPDDPPVIQVVRRFHKVLDFLEAWLLGKLRDAELQKKFRTLTATPVSLSELKLRWESEGHPLVVSNYGDTHEVCEVEMLEKDQVVSIAESNGVSSEVASYLFALTGGYPEPFSRAANEWIRRGRPLLSPEVRKGLRSVATKGLATFVKWLDCKGKHFYRDCVIDLYQGFNSEESYLHLSNHPWRNFLFDGEYGLRAECVGEAAIGHAVRSVGVEGGSGHFIAEMENRARQMYGRKQYHAAKIVLENIRVEKQIRPDLAIFQAHVRVMNALYDGDSPGEDTDWQAVLREVRQANTTLEQHKAKLNHPEIVIARLAELERIAECVVQVQGKDDVRLVDVLCGLRGPNDRHPDVAAILLLLKYDSCRAIPGHASACQAALFLPEQIFRLWAFWSLGVNYYQAPENEDAVWLIAESEWPFGNLNRTRPGREFQSFPGFAYFALAKRLHLGADKVPAMVNDFPALERELAMVRRLRNPKAHSYCCTNSNDRDEFFTLIDEWLDCLVHACPAKVTRSQLLGMIEPLPLVDRNGIVIFE